MHFNFIYTDLNIQRKSFVDKLKCVAPEYVRKILIKNNNKIITAFIYGQTSQLIEFDNRLNLTKAKDPIGVEQVKLYWKSLGQFKTPIKNIEEIVNFFIDQNIGRVAAEEFVYSNTPFPHEGGGHHMGGTRIGFDSFSSVVDKNLMVHDVENLYCRKFHFRISRICKSYFYRRPIISKIGRTFK